MDIVTMTTASRSLQKGGPVKKREGGGDIRRRMRREGETKQKTGGWREGPPDLDLDKVEEEALEEEERRRRTRQRPRQKGKRDEQKEEGTRSRSLPRSSTQPREVSPHEDRNKETDEAVIRRRRRHSEGTRGSRAKEAEGVREDKRDDGREKTTRHAKDSGSSAPAQRSAFSFLRPMEDDDDQHVSDDESASSFSEVSLSAASIATAGWRDDWGAASPWEQRQGPGPWLKPSSQRLTTVLIGSRLSGQRLVGGLSL